MIFILQEGSKIRTLQEVLYTSEMDTITKFKLLINVSYMLRDLSKENLHLISKA
jgi:hypothetical protein